MTEPDPLRKLQESFAAVGLVTFRDGCRLVTKNLNLDKYLEVYTSLYVDAVFEYAEEEFGFHFFELPECARYWSAAGGIKVQKMNHPKTTIDSINAGIDLLSRALEVRGWRPI